MSGFPDVNVRVPGQQCPGSRPTVSGFPANYVRVTLFADNDLRFAPAFLAYFCGVSALSLILTFDRYSCTSLTLPFDRNLP